MIPMRFTRLLRQSASRRHILRGLTALGFSTVLRPPDAAQARKGKKKPKKRKPGTVCPSGQLVGSVAVPGTGAPVLTPLLRQGQRYRLRASGFWRSNATHGQDAFADFPLANPTSHTTDFEGVRLGLAVDSGSPDLWGSYTPNHEYERVVTGQGGALALRCNDAIHLDNSGAVFVEVFCA